jgi:hypothetical protein
MFGKKVIVSGVAGLLMLGTVVGSVSAQTPPAEPPAASQGWSQQQQQNLQGRGPGYMQNQQGRGLAYQQDFQGRGMGYTQAEAPVAKALGITVEDLHAQRLAGKSLAQIAEEKGVSTEAVVDAMVASKEAALDARVEAGALTQEQANTALETMKARIAESINRTEVGPNRPADGQGLSLAFGRGAMGQQLGPQDGTGFGPRGFRR